MRFSLNINYPLEKAEQSRKRLQAKADFKYVDRVPVLLCLVPRFFAPIIGNEYADLFKDAETQYHLLLQYEKYRIENIPEDHIVSNTIYIEPWFETILNAASLGAEIPWTDADGYSRAIPCIKSIDDVDKFEIPDPNSGLWAKKLEWWSQMKEFASQTEVKFNGKRGKVELMPLSITAEGPHLTAVDLVGSDFYWWMIDYPESCHKLLDKITKALIQAEQNYRRIDPRPRRIYALAEDSIQLCSLELFREFALPYDKMMYDVLGKGIKDGRGLHMCGDSRHLHKAMIEEAQISHFILFGSKLEPELVAKNLGGKMYLWGNIDPILMLNGTKHEVKHAAKRCLEAMAPCGGYMLGDGANPCPGTPLENLAALVEAAEEYGLPADQV